MSSKIDEFSRLLGNIESELKENRRLADQRHEEDKENFRRVEGKVDSLSIDAMQDRAVSAQLTAAAILDKSAIRGELGKHDEHIKGHDDRIKLQERFHDRFGGIMWAVGTLIIPAVLGALWLLWRGAEWLLSTVDFRALLGR